MARKQLIKGANAARVEERIARVPLDLDASQDRLEDANIFGAIKALEEKERGALRVASIAAPVTGPIAVPTSSPIEVPGKARSRPRRIGPSDFTSDERETILRCCTDYRNRLPTYLLAVQKEVRMIDSVIAKCRGED